MKIIITDEKEVCWKLNLTADMDLDEIIEGIEKQFYTQEIFKRSASIIRRSKR